MSAPSSSAVFQRARLAGVATVLALGVAFGAEKAPAKGGGSAPAKSEEKKAPSFSEKASTAFSKLKPLQDAQDWNGMLKLLEDTRPTVAPGSYDEAFILNMIGKLYGQKGEYAKALGPWERAIQLSEQDRASGSGHGFFPEKETLEITYYLGSLYAQEAASSKDPKIQQNYFGKALSYFKVYMAKTPTPSQEAVSTYALILYSKAVADPKNVDQEALKEARTVVERGLASSIKPKEYLYQLLLALMQQQNVLVGSAEVLELVQKQNPQKKDNWQMLMAIYLQLSEKVKDDPATAREYLVRAIVTAERAQALGYLNGPKENMTLVSLYLMANQFTKGTELLYNGMKKGTIESEPHNWRILGRYYQEANLNEQAATVLQEATKLFPKNGELEVQIAQIYLQMEKSQQAFDHANAAIAKGNFEGTKPYSVHYLIAYTAYELGKIEEADKALAAAEKFPEAAKDPQFARLKDVVKEMIAERQAKEKETEDASKKKKDDKKAPQKTAANPSR